MRNGRLAAWKTSPLASVVFVVVLAVAGCKGSWFRGSPEAFDGELPPQSEPPVEASDDGGFDDGGFDDGFGVDTGFDDDFRGSDVGFDG